jgi:hypothetical protein
MLSTIATVDLEGPPSNLYYINEFNPAPGISLVNEATFGCSCTDCFFEKCCPAEAGVALIYNKNQQIRLPFMTATQHANVDLIVPIELYKKTHNIPFASFELTMAVPGV